MKHIYRIGALGLMLLTFSCSKDKEVAKAVPEEPKPRAVAEIIKDLNNAFTFEFKSTSLNAKSTRWTFGDDSVAIVPTAKHTYLYAGVFKVLLRVENEQGYVAQQEMTINISPEKILTIQAKPTTDGDVKFDAVSATAFKDFKWTFADNSTSTDASPKKKIAEGKIETVTLNVTTEQGSTIEMKKMIGSFGGISDVTKGAVLAVSDENGNGAFGGEGSLKLIDGDNSTKFFSGGFNPNFWMKQTLIAPQVVRVYSITSGNDEKVRDPKDWTLQGSMDGNVWDVLDTRKVEFSEARNEVRAFAFENTKAYPYYRWYVTSNWGNISIFQASEWRLFRID